MFTLNTTIDDSSPLITYSPANAWLEASALGDSEIQRYWGESYTQTFVWDASATFEFDGTGVTVLGGKRNFRGGYTVRLDGEEQETSDAFSVEGEYRAVLFSAHNLEQTRHRVVIRNAGMSLDIDCILWTAEIGEGREAKSPPTLLDDSDDAFTWWPQGAWSTDLENLAGFQSASGHSTNQLGARVNYTFEGISGDAVSLFGTVGPDHSRYIVSVDGHRPEDFSATREASRSRVLLFHANNLGNGSHSVVMTNVEEKVMQVDYALTFVDQDTSVISSSLPTESSAAAATDTDSDTGLIVGVAVAGGICLFHLLGLLILFRRYKRMRRRIMSRYNVDPDSDPPFKPPVTHVFTGPLTPHYETRSFPPGTLAQHARQGSQSNQPLMSEIPHKEEEDENKLRPNRWSDAPSPQVIRTAGEASRYHEELAASSNQSLSAFRANSAPSSKSGSLISRFSDWSRRQRLGRTPSGPRPLNRSSSTRELLMADESAPHVHERETEDQGEEKRPHSQPPEYWQATSPTTSVPERHYLPSLASQSTFYFNGHSPSTEAPSSAHPHTQLFHVHSPTESPSHAHSPMHLSFRPFSQPTEASLTPVVAETPSTVYYSESSPTEHPNHRG